MPELVKPRDISGLSPRLREFARYRIRGLSIKEAAYAMGCTEKTAQVHADRLYKSLQVHNVAELIRATIGTDLDVNKEG